MKSASRTTLHMGRFLALVQEGRWEYVDRVNAAGASLIVAVTDGDRILLLEQFRIPVGCCTIELPAGLIGDDKPKHSESDNAAACRGLLEETGYQAARKEVLTSGAACSGLTSEAVTLFKASGLQRVGEGGGVGHEDIKVHEVPLKEVHGWLEKKASDGAPVDPKVYAGLYFTK